MLSDKLSVTVSLTMGSTTHEAPGGTVRRLALRLEAWGFEGEVTFAVLSDQQEDEVLAPFLTQDLARVTIAVAGAHYRTDSPPEALTLTGTVTDKALAETAVKGTTGEEVLLREYTVRFADAPSVLWSQHRPLLLAAETTVADVLSGQVVEGITFSATLDEATAQRPHVCLPLGGQRASFYDLLVWYADTRGGHLVWDYGAGSLTLAGEKPGAGTPGKVRNTEVGAVRVLLPPVRRHAARLLNSYAEAPTTTDVPQDHAVAGVSHDFVVRSAVPAEADARQALEERRLGLRGHELEVRFRHFPDVPWWPGLLAGLQAEHFSAGLLGRDTTWRVARAELRVEATEDLLTRDWMTAARAYAGEMTVLWEAQDDAVPRLPPYVAPRWPVRAEGKVVCATGAEGDRTYAFQEDADTSLQTYEVRVPLWDCVVKAPFEPIFLPGHVYAPAYRDSRVLLALELHTAAIVEFLDWGAGVQLPMDSQGNQVLFGKNATDQTALEHAYVDDKPVFTVLRTKDKDTELLQMEEGILVLQTREVE